MICPRCSVAELAEDTQQCPLCGFSSSSNVLVDQATVDETLEAVREALAEQYNVQAVLRLGVRSLVYLAQEYAHERLVALKVIPIPGLVDPERAQRFESQMERAAGLKHSHIVPILNYGSTRQFLWYAMEHDQAQSLAEVLRAQGPLDLQSMLRIAEQVASALDYAHREGVTHGNLKPEDIFVDEGKWVRVGDFSVLGALGRHPSGQAGVTAFGRPEYLAPEQFYARSVGASADQYAFAIILYQCLTGMLPFVGDSLEEVARQHANEPPPRLSEHRPDLPLYVLDGIQRALAKWPGGRFPTVLDFVSALKSGPPRASGRRSAPIRRSSAATAVLTIDYDPPGRKRRWVLVALAVVLLLVTGSVFVPQVRDALGPLGASIGGLLGADNQQTAAPRPIQWQTAEPVFQPPQRLDSGVTPPASTPLSAAPTAPTQQAQRPSRRPPPTQPARLFVSATPWGVLYIDGQRMGNTPKANIELAPGTHRIRVERDGFDPYETEVEVAPGETLRLTGIVLAPRQQ